MDPKVKEELERIAGMYFGLPGPGSPNNLLDLLEQAYILGRTRAAIDALDNKK